jgi:hypothetical protein
MLLIVCVLGLIPASKLGLPERRFLQRAVLECMMKLMKKSRLVPSEQLHFEPMVHKGLKEQRCL